MEMLAELTFSGLSCFQFARGQCYIIGSCNVGTCDLPDTYALSPLASSMHTRQITHVYFTTNTYCTMVMVINTLVHSLVTLYMMENYLATYILQTHT